MCIISNVIEIARVKKAECILLKERSAETDIKCVTIDSNVSQLEF